MIRAAAIVALVSTLGLAQAAVGPPMQTPARDAARPAVGTATVSGVVVTDEASPRPVRRVHVALQSIDLRAPIASVTDDDGRFTLQGVLAGHYTVMASRPGYVETILGASAGSLLGAPIAVADGEQVTGLTIRLAKGAVITGTVRYPSGKPASGVQVMVSPVKTVDGRRRTRFSTDVRMAGTDDRGVYRQFGLAPGDYLVQVASEGFDGSFGELRQTTPSEASWGDRFAASTAPAGTVNAPPPGRLVARAPIYYPGTANIDDARPITVGVAEERDGIDLTIEYVPTARLSGKVFDQDGQPRAGVTVRLNGKMGSSIADMISSLVGRGGHTSEDGAFTIEAVPPGEYTLTSQAAAAADAAAKPAGADARPNLMTMMSGLFGGNTSGSLYASETAVVSGQDITNLELRLRPGVSVSGSVVFDGTATRPSLEAMQIMVIGVSQTTSAVELAMSMMQGVSGRVAPDLTFMVKGVVPNRYRVSANLPGMLFGAVMPNATWTLKSIRIGEGPDLADTPFEIPPGPDLTGLVVTLTDRPTLITGKVMDGEGRPSSAFPIIVFSTDPSHWAAGSRRVQQVRPASDGSYRIRGLPAGEYYVGAVTTLDLEDLFDPSFLKQIAPVAFRLTLADGEARQQDLKLGGGRW